MIEPPFDDANLPTTQEIREETEPFLEREVISYHAITDADYTSKWMIYPVNSPERQQVAGHVARYFHKEAGFDMRPYSPGDESERRPVYLLRSVSLLTMVPLIAGAVGFRLVQGDWILTWIWIHPWERGGALAQRTFDTLDEQYPGFFIEGPIRKPMRGLMAKRGYDGRERTIVRQ